MKKTAFCIVLLLAAALLSSCGGSELEGLTLTGTYTDEYAGTEINVANWGEYIADGTEGTLDVNAAFEELTGITVNYTTYDSNESLYAKMKSGAVSYDVVVPSDYMIERMIAEGMLQTIDFTALNNAEYISAASKNAYYDPNMEYSVPYLGGTLGLVYNTTMVDSAPDSWLALWDESLADNILTFNNARDCFALAMLIEDIDVNTTDTALWDQAAELLKEQAPLVQGRVGDEIFNKMEGANAAIASCYAGDYLIMMENNEDLAFVYPAEGSTVFWEACCIPASAQNYEAALLYLNFLMEPEVALANAEYTVYMSPNTAVQENPEYTWSGNEILYPDTADMQYYTDLPADVRSYYEHLWEEILL